MIGIFWIHKDAIYSYKEEVLKKHEQDVEIGHVEYWRQLQVQHKILSEFPYDYIPRGRVLLSEGKFKIYSSKEIISEKKYHNLILNCFELKDANFIYDEHYQKILDLGFDM